MSNELLTDNMWNPATTFTTNHHLLTQPNNQDAFVAFGQAMLLDVHHPEESATGKCNVCINDIIIIGLALPYLYWMPAH